MMMIVIIKLMSQFKHQALEQIKSKQEENPLHGQYLKGTKEKDVDQGKILNWLSTADLKSETEGFIIAAQYQWVIKDQQLLKQGSER